MIDTIIRTIRIYKMPGFQDGIREIEKMGRRMTIIFGPNASGKSSLSNALQRILWQDKDKDTRLHAKVERGTESYDVTVHAEKREWTDNRGARVDMQAAPAQHRKHYRFALEEVILAQDADIAQEIIRQSAGGYDIDAALKAEDLIYLKPSKPNSGLSDLLTSMKAVKDEEERQDKLKTEMSTLGDIDRRLSEIDDAARRVEWIRDLEDYLEKSALHETTQTRLNQFDTRLQNMYDNDHANAETLRRELQDYRQQIEHKEEEIYRVQQALDDSPIPRDGWPDARILELELHAGTLERMEDGIRTLQQSRDAALQSERRLAESIDAEAGIALQPAILAEPSREQYASFRSQLEIHLQRTNTLDAQERQLERLQEELNGLPVAAQGVEALGQAVAALREWLSVARRQVGIPMTGIILSILLAIFGGITVILKRSYFQEGLLLLAAALGLMLFLLWRMRDTGGTDPQRDQCLERYRRAGFATGNPVDEAWVSAELERLLRLLAAQDRHRELSTLIRAAETAIQRTKDQLAQTAQAIDDFRVAFAYLPPLMAPDTPPDYLLRCLDMIAEWRKAHLETMQRSSELATAQQQWQDGLQQMQAVYLEPDESGEPWTHGYPMPARNDAAAWRAHVEDMKKLQSEWQQNRTRLGHATDLRDQQSNELQHREKRLQEIYDRIGIEEEHSLTLQQLAASLQDFRESMDTDRNAKAACETAEQHLRTYGCYDSSFASDGARKRQELAEERERLQQKINERDTLVNQKATIKAEADRATRGHDLEGLVLNQDMHLEHLDAQYEKHMDSIVASAIAEVLKERNRTVHQPEILKNASAWLTRFTGGRYRLEVDDQSKPPVFHAQDTEKMTWHRLDTLSTGTKMQLIMAARLAYVEHIEQGLVRYPLFADEVLATSDPERARAIMEAFLEIAKSGRQVFVFTADTDEVARWNQVVPMDDTDYLRLRIDRDGLREAPNPPWRGIDPILQPELPVPGTMDHEEYGRLLQVPPFGMEQPTEGLHLWYLITDTQILYECLKRSVRCWGDLKQWHADGFMIPGMSQNQFEAYLMDMEALDTYQNLLLQGRAKKIDESVIRASGQVSDAFMDRVLQLLRQLDGDPEAFVERLMNKGVPNFQREKAKRLEDFFLNSGFIRDGEKLDDDAIRLRMDEKIHRNAWDRDRCWALIGRIR